MLVHGIITSRYLLPTVRELARFTCVLVPDLRGFTANDSASGVPDLASQADAVAVAINDWESGGHTVVYTDPRRLAELVLRSPPGEGDREWPRRGPAQRPRRPLEFRNEESLRYLRECVQQRKEEQPAT